ncbi:MAG: tetratricopeptide repeat protein [Acidobacteriota bacterium]
MLFSSLSISWPGRWRSLRARFQPTDPATAARRRAIAWPVALALLVRLLFFADNARSAFFALPVLDEQFYDQAARALLAARDGALDTVALGSGFRPLLYPALLAAIYGLFGAAGPAAALVVQHLFGAVTTGLVAAATLRLGARPGAAAAAGCLYALAGPPIYFEGQLLATSLATLLAAAWLLAALALRLDRPDVVSRCWTPWLALGVVTALLALARPNGLLLLGLPPLAAVLVVYRSRRRGADTASETDRLAPRLALRTGACLGAALVVLALAGFLQRGVTDGFRLLPGAGGVNFYLGNERGADGRQPLQDRHTASGDRYVDSVALFATEEARAAGVARHGSGYWLQRTVGEITADPTGWLGLMARKALYLTWTREIPNNRSFAFAATHESRVLGALPIRWGVLLVLAGIGLLAARREGLRAGWPVAFLATWGAGVLLFFVAGRYRLPMWPAMAVLAGIGVRHALGGLAGVRRLDRSVRQRALKRLVVGAAVAFGLGTLTFVDWTGVGPESWFRDYYFRSIAWQERGELDHAIADAETALALHLDDPAARFQLGTLRMEEGRLDRALIHLDVARNLEPNEPRIYHNLGLVHEKLGDRRKAFISYRHAVSLAPDYSPPRVALALLELQAGRVDEAARLIAEAEALGNPSIALLVAQAALADVRGDLASAAAILERARARDADATREVLERLAPQRKRPDPSPPSD